MDPQRHVRTRTALHAVAEHLLAGPQYRAAGTIRLRVRPGGFACRFEPQLRVRGAELVGAGRALALSGVSCAELGAAVGVAAGRPEGLYGDGSGVPVDAPLELDPEAAEAVAACFAHGDAALRALFPQADPVLWPEHFDLGVTVDAVNYGISPGDAYLPEPYAYVGPHTPPSGEFWNAPFGAARTLAALGGPAATTAFLAEGRRLAGGT
ncbi:hypothetical protein [Streptomyces sp. TLI_171]|uniref:hypothetical protein n=1 Tax=Streptomyces sp. TLI_171 TaxID=1938859 RepID=UPI000C181B3D|nr:hypothetical protein [Streptomyces sp. TLI_171]RKE17955.1 hypothetical protein BX266_1226 [Streptomyces sp. TLI_171]